MPVLIRCLADNHILGAPNTHGPNVILECDANDDINTVPNLQDNMSPLGGDFVITTRSNSLITLKNVDITDLDVNGFVF